MPKYPIPLDMYCEFQFYRLPIPTWSSMHRQNVFNIQNAIAYALVKVISHLTIKGIPKFKTQKRSVHKKQGRHD